MVGKSSGKQLPVLLQVNFNLGRILRHEHDNVINPGHSDNVCTVGELEETLPEFKALLIVPSGRFCTR